MTDGALLMRVPEAAHVLGIGRDRLYAMVAAGEIPSILIGRQRRIPRAALLAWVDQNIDGRRTEPGR
jgi:excisionase family DNA binding protein